MKVEKQYVSLAGQPDGQVELVDYRQPAGQTHRLLRPAHNTSPLMISLGDILPPAGYADALKVSGVINADIRASEVQGGSEDVLDVNHSRNVLVHIQRAVPRGRYVSTIKGGSQRIDLMITEQIGHGRETDHDLGNWSDQSKERTKGVSLDVAAADGSPVRVRVLHATKPTLAANGRWKVSSWMSPWFQAAYAILKKIGVA